MFFGKRMNCIDPLHGQMAHRCTMAEVGVSASLMRQYMEKRNQGAKEGRPLKELTYAKLMDGL